MKIFFNSFSNLAIKTSQYNHSNLLRAYKIIYYKSGNGQMMINSNVYHYKAGMFAMITPNEIYEEIATDQTEEFICEFKMDLDTYSIHSGLYYDYDGCIQKQFERIRREFESSESFRDAILDLYATELYYFVLRNLNGCFEKTISIQEIIHYIDEFYYDDIKVEELAKKAGYTCRHFRNLFIERTGVPPSEYLLKHRIEHAKELLSTSTRNMVEISQSCGFSSASQFAMLFKRYIGLTPSEYRNKKITA